MGMALAGITALALLTAAASLFRKEEPSGGGVDG